MGRIKQILPLGNSTILEQTLDRYLNSISKEFILVLGKGFKSIMELVAYKPIKIIVNHDYSKGISTSIKAGLALISSESDGILLALADQPFINTTTINHIIMAFSRCNKGIIIPVYKGNRGNPVLFSVKYKHELLSLSGDIGGREILKKYGEDIYEISVDCKGVLIDIDTDNDYREAFKNSI